MTKRSLTIVNLQQQTVPFDVNDATDGWRIAFDHTLEVIAAILQSDCSFIKTLMQQKSCAAAFKQQTIYLASLTQSNVPNAEGKECGTHQAVSKRGHRSKQEAYSSGIIHWLSH